MIVIVANRWDPTPRLVAARRGFPTFATLTAEDLSAAGWRQRLHSLDGDAVVERKVLPDKEITGVLTLLPRVFEDELVEVVPVDRSYVAAEMTSFLFFWLSRLRCPVLNRPTPTCLSGPYWRREKWVHVAAQAGIPVDPVRRQQMSPGFPIQEEALVPAGATATVIGDRVFGECEPALHLQALSLARLAQVDFLSIQFSGPERGAHFVGANVFPDLSDDKVTDSILEYLQDGLTR
jgi:hypothetical protein